MKKNRKRGINKALIIGIASHDDIPVEHMATLELIIRSLLNDIRSDNYRIPITIFSSLREGADQLCARLGLLMGMRLVVPLPMALEDYRQEFSAEGAKNFDYLLARAKRYFVAPKVELDPEITTPKTERDFGYRQAGLYIARHCDILLALWDGEPTDDDSDVCTYEVVSAALRNNTEIWHIKVPRHKELGKDDFIARVIKD